MRALFDEIEKVAPTRGPRADHGRERHRQGADRARDPPPQRARDGPFVKVNCAAIPRELIESELFGHERGAFTGAHSRKKGIFEQAHGGTLFLDEIGDMSLGAQAKVLRALQSGEITRVGSERAIAVDVRVLAATNKDLESEVDEGRLPRGPLLPAQRRPDPQPGAARARRGHPAARAGVPRASSAARTAAREKPIDPRGASSCSRSGRGRATCASCAT